MRSVLRESLPTAIEVRVPGRTVRHLIDYDRLPLPRCATAATYSTMCAHAVLELRAHLIEEAILDGHNRIEVQIDGDPTTVHYLPSWFTETRAWLKVWRARRRRRRERETMAAKVRNGDATVNEARRAAGLGRREEIAEAADAHLGGGAGDLLR